MQCPRCNAPIEEGATFCGNCGNQIAPLQQGVTVNATAAQPQQGDYNPNFMQSRYGSPGSVMQAQQPPSSYSPMPGQVQGPPGSATPPLAPTRDSLPPSPWRPNLRMVLIIALVVVVIAAGTIAFLVLSKGGGGTTANTANGTVSFVDSPNSQGRTDALSITVNALAAPSSGSNYYAWIVNDQSEHITPLGQLTASGQQFTLNYAGNGTNLLGLGNKLEISLEQGKPSAPTSVVLAGTFPPLAFVHIKHILFAFPITPNHIGLLVGVLGQTQLLNTQASLLQNAAAGHNTVATQCIAQSMIDIIEGQQGHHYQPLGPACASQNINITGDGFGLIGPNGFLSLAAAHASLAATQTDSTESIKIHARHVEICLTNIQSWAATIDQDALGLVANPGNTSKIQEIVTLSDHTYHGVAINGNEQPQPIPGSGGAETAYIHGQLMAGLTLTPAS
jgi:flagellar basal body-associated protein FliL